MKSFWGWRAFILCLFICVMIVSCVSAPSTPYPSPTEIPSITLFLRSNQALTPPSMTLTPLIITATLLPSPTPVIYYAGDQDSLARIALNSGIPPAILQTANPGVRYPIPPGRQIAIPNPPATLTPLDIDISPPTCYPTEPRTLICIGSVTNPHAVSLQRVALIIRLTDDDGQPIAEQVAQLEQSYVPSGVSAPYRAIFVLDQAHDDRLYAGVVVVPLSADPESRTRTPPGVWIDADEVTLLDGRYRLDVALASDTPTPPGHLRLVLTVYDAAGQVGGFRVADLIGWQGGEPARLQLEVPLLRESGRWWHTLHIEAFP